MTTTSNEIRKGTDGKWYTIYEPARGFKTRTAAVKSIELRAIAAAAASEAACPMCGDPLPKAARDRRVARGGTVVCGKASCESAAADRALPVNDRMTYTRKEFIAFLEDTLIPDLRAAGMDSTADDFRLAVRFMRGEDR